MKIIIWRKIDGTVFEQCPVISSKNPSQTEDEFLDNLIEKTRKRIPEFNDYTAFKFDKAEFYSKLGPNPNIDKARMSVSGNVTTDPSIKTPEEIRIDKVNNVRTKLKSLGLTDDELDTINIK